MSMRIANKILKWLLGLFKSKLSIESVIENIEESDIVELVPKDEFYKGYQEVTVYDVKNEAHNKSKPLKHIFFFRKIQLLGKIIIHKRDRYRIVKSAGQILYDSAGGKLRNKYGYKMIQL